MKKKAKSQGVKALVQGTREALRRDGHVFSADEATRALWGASLLPSLAARSGDDLVKKLVQRAHQLFGTMQIGNDPSVALAESRLDQLFAAALENRAAASAVLAAHEMDMLGPTVAYVRELRLHATMADATDVRVSPPTVIRTTSSTRGAKCVDRLTSSFAGPEPDGTK